MAEARGQTDPLGDPVVLLHSCLFNRRETRMSIGNGRWHAL